jgi:hypothetical protein
MFAEAARSGDRHSTVFGRGLDATNSFFDGVVDLPPAGNEYQKRSRCRRLQRVPAVGFAPSGSVVDRDSLGRSAHRLSWPP